MFEGNSKTDNRNDEHSACEIKKVVKMGAEGRIGGYGWGLKRPSALDAAIQVTACPGGR